MGSWVILLIFLFFLIDFQYGNIFSAVGIVWKVIYFNNINLAGPECYILFVNIKKRLIFTNTGTLTGSEPRGRSSQAVKAILWVQQTAFAKAAHVLPQQRQQQSVWAPP